MRGLANPELDGIRCGSGQRFNGARQIFDAGEKASFVEHAVIDGDIEAAAGLGIKETIESGCFQRDVCWVEEELSERGGMVYEMDTVWMFTPKS